VPGGTAYTVGLTATDDHGNVMKKTFKTEYIATPTTAVSEDRLIGIHYYSWWGSGWHWNSGYDGTPVLDQYNSRNPDVISQHFKWLQNGGINWLSLSWYGRDSWSGITAEDYLLEADGVENFDLSILYESQNLLEQDEDTYRTNFDREVNRSQLISDIEYLADNLFHRDEYLHIEGKPVFYPYTSSGFYGDIEGTIAEAEGRIGKEIYLIGDFPFQKWPPAKAHNLDVFDALANYSAFYQPWEDINELVPEQPRKRYTEWLLRTQSDSQLNFIPTMSPGFDKTSHEDSESKELPILDGSPEKFSEWCRTVRRLMDSDLEAVLLTSFNEWHEGTQLEPGANTSTGLLDVVDTDLRTAEFLHRNLDTIARVVLKFSDTISEHETNSDADEEFNRELAFTLVELELIDSNGDWSKKFTVSGDGRSPYFIEGAFDYNADWERRWCGGLTGRTVLGFDWSDVSRADELHVTAAPQWNLGDITVTGGIENGVLEARTIERGDPEKYSFPLALS